MLLDKALLYHKTAFLLPQAEGLRNQTPRVVLTQSEERQKFWSPLHCQQQ